VGHFKRDDEQGHGEAEDDVGEGVDAGHGGATKAEAVACDVFVEDVHCLKAIRTGIRDWLDAAEGPGREGEERADELEDAADHYADETEREQDQPDEGVEDYRDQGDRPADYEKDQEEKQFHGGAPYIEDTAGKIIGSRGLRRGWTDIPPLPYIKLNS
jgi:hypothetical protein